MFGEPRWGRTNDHLIKSVKAYPQSITPCLNRLKCLIHRNDHLHLICILFALGVLKCSTFISTVSIALNEPDEVSKVDELVDLIRERSSNSICITKESIGWNGELFGKKNLSTNGEVLRFNRDWFPKRIISGITCHFYKNRLNARNYPCRIIFQVGRKMSILSQK